MRREVLIIFVAAFILNLLWEELHSVFYVSYQGGAITHLILLHAALFDATVITVFSYLFLLWKPGFYNCGSLVSTAAFAVSLILFAILLEKWALLTGRWVYADAMPLIPMLNVGLTPIIQLGILGYISIRASDWLSAKTLAK